MTTASLKRNVLANYLSQIYVMVIGVALVPLYIQYMGPEAYGLVGFLTMLQAWFLLLDLGLTPMIARETARFRAGAVPAVNYRRLVSTLECLFFMVGLVGGIGLLVATGYVASDWLKTSLLSVAEVQTALQCIALIVVLRWMCGLYRGLITGSEKFVWLAGYNSIIATMRFVGVVPVLILVGATPQIFFTFHLLIAIIELSGFTIYAYRLLPSIRGIRPLSWSWISLQPVLKLSLTISATSSIWIVATQSDKLLLSKLLPLADYGFFTLAVLAAGGVSLIAGPITSALMPRLAALEAQNDHGGMIRIYRQATQLVVVIVAAVALTVAFCAKQLLHAWTGDPALAEKVAPILILYGLGNGIMAISAFSYYLQYALGNLRFHLIGHIGFVVLLIPTLLWLTEKFGGVGAGYAWLGSNLLYLFVWVPLVNRILEPGLNCKWYGRDILPIVGLTTLCAFLLAFMLPDTTQRLLQGVVVMAFGLTLLSVGILASPVVRQRAYAVVNGYMTRN